MAYFSYHAKAKKLIREGHLDGYAIIYKYKGISPALLLFFDNNRPMPIRVEKWEEYFELINKK